MRHSFEEIGPEDAQTTIRCFLAFAEAEKWGTLRALEELKKELENWDNHSPYQSEELTKAIAQIEQLKKENQNLAEKANAYGELQNQLNVVSARESLLKNELAETEARLSKKDAKLVNGNFCFVDCNRLDKLMNASVRSTCSRSQGLVVCLSMRHQ